LGKYDPISAHFATLPPAQESHRLRLEQIDTLLGKPLPTTARSDRTWWANTESSNHARSWLSAGWKVNTVDFGAGAVDFVRANGSTIKRSSRRAAFVKLHEFFAALPAEQEQIALTFDEIESIIERKLRPTALRDRTWWANAAVYEPAKHWMSAGWRVEAVYMKARTIVFRRKGTAVLEMIRQWVKRFLDHGAVVGGLDAHTIGGWIRQCRRLNWYFEGTVLYERSSVSFSDLDEQARADVDEDYDVCKRELNRYRQAQMVTSTG
jgi:hypothetical protein